MRHEIIGQELERLRARLFVGRRQELETLEALLLRGRYRACYVQGMGGIGKTELLHAFGRSARADGWDVVYIDARDVIASTEALGAALLERGDLPERRLVLLDSFEHLSAVERPFRERLLPRLPAAWRMLFAGRSRLGSAWSADPGWSELLKVLELGELSLVEAKDYLMRKRVHPTRFAEVLDLTGGVPLALALASAAAGETPAGELEADPDLTEQVLERVIEREPSSNHRRALALSALVLSTTEELLHRVVGDGSATELFDWLASRPFFEGDARAVQPHEVVRDALIRRLRWRRPDLFIELLIAAGEYHSFRLQRSPGSAERARTVRELNFLMAQGDIGPLLVDAYYRFRSSELRANDWPVMKDIVAEQAGPDAADHLRAWREHQAFDLLAVRRGDDEEIRGFLVGIKLHLLTAAEARSIPGVDKFAERFGPFDRPSCYLWMWGDRMAGHALSPTQTCAMEWVANQILSNSDTSHSAMAVQEGLDWIHTGTVRTSPKPVAECAFQLGPARYVVINKTHIKDPIDWFAEMAEEWLELLRGAAMAPPSDLAQPPVPSPGAVLHALKQALKRADRPDELEDNELFGLKVVANRASGASTQLERGRALSEFLQELARETLRSPRDEIYYQALHRTYFEPAPKQRAVADDLRLAYSTYRRHLTATIGRLANALIQLELAARAEAGP